MPKIKPSDEPIHANWQHTWPLWVDSHRRTDRVAKERVGCAPTATIYRPLTDQPNAAAGRGWTIDA